MTKWKRILDGKSGIQVREMILHGSHMADTREFAQQIVHEILSQSGADDNLRI